MPEIVRDEDVLGGDPRIEGTRVGVLHVAELAIDGGYDPADVADQFDVHLAEVYAALAYYYDNPEEMRRIKREHDEAVERLRETSLKPKDPVS